MGAIASGDVRILNEALISQLELPSDVVNRVIAREQRELNRRERHYREGRPTLEVVGRTVILADDGIATGRTTMLAAIRALTSLRPKRIVVAVPSPLAQPARRSDRR
jgi:putative phosphoribosyl transferase